jgi:hypothetical protein
MQSVEIISVLLLFALVVTLLVWWQHSRADEILRRWAQAAGVELVSAQKRYLRTGPFLLYSRGQFVFRIIVRDQAGTQRAGWLRAGGWLAGVLSDKTKVIWDS